MTRRQPLDLVLFFVLAYALSWAWWLPMAISGAVVVPGDTPTHIPGLLGPAIAAFIAAALAGGRAALADLVQRIVRVRFSWRGWAAAFAPVAFLAIGAVAQRLFEGAWPDLAGLGRYSGIPRYGVAAVLALAFVVNGLGEEIGWRGYALPRLQARFGPRAGTFILWPLWAFWHAPMFWFVATFMQMNAFIIVVGFGLGILSGTLVLANVAHLARGSVLATAIWHLTYNAATATDVGATTQAIATVLVIVWAVLLLWREWSRPRASLLLVPPPAA